MFPYSDNIIIENNYLRVYFDISKDITHFHKNDIILLFEGMKFSDKIFEIQYNKNVLGKIETIIFNNDVIELNIKLYDPTKNLIELNDSMRFFISVYHDNYKHLKYHELIII